MAKLYFRYGVMGSSKTANALMVRYNYEEKGKYAWLIKPAIDTRDDIVGPSGRRIATVKSRIGLSAAADVINEDESVLKAFYNLCKQMNVDPKNPPSEGLKVDAVIVDEAQFCSEDQISELRTLVDTFGLPVICYGLRTDFQTKLFPGSKRLLEVADVIEQVKHICECGKAAQVNARLDSMGNVITQGAQVEIGGNEKYEAMCWRCWNDRISTRVEVEF